MAVNLLLVSSGTGRTCPSIATRRLGGQRWLNTPHMEEVLAPVAFHGVLSVREGEFENLRDEKSARDLRCAPLLACFAQANVRC